MSDHEIEIQRRRLTEMRGALERRALLDGSELEGLEGLEDAKEFVVAGYASTFDEVYDLGSFKERVSPKAFDRSLKALPDVVFNADHGRSLSGLPLARTRSAKGGPGTLTLRADDHGLSFSARLARDDPDASSLVRAIQSGRLWQCSFAFRVNRDSWNSEGTIRTLEEVNLNAGDISVVAHPANPATSVAARSFERAARLRTPNYARAEREQLALRAVQAGSGRRVSSPVRPDLPDPGWYRARIQELRSSR